MARDGAGVYSLPAGTAAVSNTTANSAHVNSRFSDIETALNTAWPVSLGGTGGTTAATARTALGLAIGTNVQAYDATLASLSGLTLAADKGLYATAADTLALYDLTAYGRSIGGVANEAAFKALVNLEIGTDVQAYSAALGQVAGLGDPNADRLVFWDDSAGSFAYLTAGTGLAISGTTITASGGRVLLATKTASASASLDFTEFDNATYRRYEFELENVKPATDSVNFLVRFSTDGGSNYDAGATDYDYAFDGSYTGGAVASRGQGTAIIINGAAATDVGNAATEFGMSGLLTLWHPGNASVYTRLQGGLSYFITTGAIAFIDGAGARLAAQDTDAIQFLFDSGNITSGTIRMYGVV